MSSSLLMKFHMPYWGSEDVWKVGCRCEVMKRRFPLSGNTLSPSDMMKEDHKRRVYLECSILCTGLFQMAFWRVFWSDNINRGELDLNR